MKPLSLAMAITLIVGSAHAIAASTGVSSTGYKLPQSKVDEVLVIERKKVKVLDSYMTYLEKGEGELVVFVHGNPTSSYLWRNIMPLIATNSRTVAPDLIGMGHSGKPDLDYTFADQYRYFDAFMKKVAGEKVTLVAHDWGSAIAWEYARNNPEQVVRLAFMEGVVPPTFPADSYESLGLELGGKFKDFKDPVLGQKLVIENNEFVEKVIPAMINRPLGEKAMAEYRAPFQTKASRKPVLAWPRQVPIAGEPEESVILLNNIAQFMGETEMPVLLLYASPGVSVPVSSVPWFIGKIKNIETSYVGEGLHFIQEDQPEAISRGIFDWMRRN